jgi:macrodomain Ter protein organizer (MatP/YcbG family)
VKYLGQHPTSVRLLVGGVEPEKLPDQYCPWGWQYLIELDDGSRFALWNEAELNRATRERTRETQRADTEQAVNGTKVHTAKCGQDEV